MDDPLRPSAAPLRELDRGERGEALRAEGADALFDALAADFHVQGGEGGRLAVRRDLWPAFEALGFTLGGRADWPESDLAGRRPLGEFEARGVRYVVRRYQHGGMLRWLTGPRFADPARPFRELLLARELARHGIPTPEAVAARAQGGLPFGWRLELVTRRLEGVGDVAHFLEDVRAGRADGRASRRVARALGALVGRLHRIGFEHADLTPRNVLLERPLPSAGEPRLWLVDLDRSRFHGDFDDGERRANLRRLLRFVVRREALGAPFLRAADLRAFLDAYGRSLGREGWSARADWRAIRRTSARREAWHRLGWAAEEWLGAGPETRDGGTATRR